MITIFGGPKTIRGQYFFKGGCFQSFLNGVVFIRVIVRDEIVCDKSVCVKFLYPYKFCF